MIDITNRHIGTSDWTLIKVTRSLNLIQRFEVLFMLCKVEQADSRSDTNAPAPKPLNVNFREYDNAASVCQTTPTALTVQWAIKHRLNAPRIYSPA